jgi:hypothetical protein
MTLNRLIHDAQGRLQHNVSLLEDLGKEFKIVIFAQTDFLSCLRNLRNILDFMTEKFEH